MANSHTNVWLKTTQIYYFMYVEIRNPSGSHGANIKMSTELHSSLGENHFLTFYSL